MEINRMALYHGTCAGNALKIMHSQKILPSTDGFFYCFDSAKPESLAGALCFATGDDLRIGSIKKNDFFAQYVQLNPGFPKGVKGAFVKAALKMAVRSWSKEQRKSITSPLDRHAAILVFNSHPDEMPRSREGFVNEVQIPEKALGSLVLNRVYLDDSLLKLPEVALLKQQGIRVEALSQCVDQVAKDCQRPQTATRFSKAPKGPKRS